MSEAVAESTVTVFTSFVPLLKLTATFLRSLPLRSRADPGRPFAGTPSTAVITSPGCSPNSTRSHGPPLSTSFTIHPPPGFSPNFSPRRAVHSFQPSLRFGSPHSRFELSVEKNPRWLASSSPSIMYITRAKTPQLFAFLAAGRYFSLTAPQSAPCVAGS